MAKKEKIPGKYTSAARRSRNDRFQEHKPHRIERSSSKENYTPKGDTEFTDRIPATMRLNRFISNAGICSRREADNLIKKSEIKVNGKLVTELGTIVSI